MGPRARVHEGRGGGARQTHLTNLAAYVERQWGPYIADDFRAQLVGPGRDLPTLADLMGRWDRAPPP